MTRLLKSRGGRELRRFTGQQILPRLLSPNVIITAGKALMLSNHLIWSLWNHGWPTEVLSSVTSLQPTSSKTETLLFCHHVWLVLIDSFNLSHAWTHFPQPAVESCKKSTIFYLYKINAFHYQCVPFDSVWRPCVTEASNSAARVLWQSGAAGLTKLQLR